MKSVPLLFRFLSGLFLAICLSGAAAAQAGRAETLRYVTSGVVNSLDPVAIGATPESTALSTAIYDRLLRFGRRPAGPDSFVFDETVIEGELAESYEVAPDGLTITILLRSGARWHDGSPVTAEDVKWSLDRAVSAQTMSKAQVATGSLTHPDQFRVIDGRRIEIRLPRPDRMALMNLATTFAPMFNASLAKAHATPDDPWATRWLKDNVAGGGAFVVQSVQPGLVTLVRNESWTSGARPGFARVLVQTVPEAATRAQLLAKGDADLTLGLQPEDLRALESAPLARVISTPMPTGFVALVFNTRMAPFDDVRVRRALAFALPYEAIFRAAFDGRGERLFGASWTGEPPSGAFPRPMPFSTDLARARALLAEAGHPDGFEASLSFGVIRSSFAEPAASLIREAFGKIGVRLRIDKLPDPQMASAITEKRLPLLLERSFALFPSTEYLFGIFASGPSRWNFASFANAEFDALLAAARTETGPARYEEITRRLVAIMAEEVPMAFLARPSFDVAAARTVAGFTTWYNYYPDLRDLRRS